MTALFSLHFDFFKQDYSTLASFLFFSLHNSNLIIGEIVEFVDHLVYLFVGIVDDSTVVIPVKTGI